MDADTLALLADNSSHLRNLQHQLSLVQRGPDPLPAVNPLPPVIDDRLAAAFVRTKKSTLPPFAADRIATEAYPIPNPPRHDFLPGENSRHIGRDPRVTWK
jgi:hypothetical protein